MVDDFVVKADLSNGCYNPKRKLEVTMHFSEIINLENHDNFHTLSFKAFLELLLLNCR